MAAKVYKYLFAKPEPPHSTVESKEDKLGFLY